MSARLSCLLHGNVLISVFPRPPRNLTPALAESMEPAGTVERDAAHLAISNSAKRFARGNHSQGKPRRHPTTEGPGSWPGEELRARPVA